MSRQLIAPAAFVLAIAVGLGAFGAHGLKELVGSSELAIWHTAVQYQFVHGLGLLGLAALSAHLDQRAVLLARALFLAGVAAFCGSLYLLAVHSMLGSPGLVTVLGPITPMGGLFFIAGWLVLGISALRKA
jgi:uncharacterized membrane protein YgdD (TMEM256/DUF423 family)